LEKLIKKKFTYLLSFKNQPNKNTKELRRLMKKKNL